MKYKFIFARKCISYGLMHSTNRPRCICQYANKLHINSDRIITGDVTDALSKKNNHQIDNGKFNTSICVSLDPDL